MQTTSDARGLSQPPLQACQVESLYWAGPEYQEPADDAAERVLQACAHWD